MYKLWIREVCCRNGGRSSMVVLYIKHLRVMRIGVRVYADTDSLLVTSACSHAAPVRVASHVRDCRRQVYALK